MKKYKKTIIWIIISIMILLAIGPLARKNTSGIFFDKEVMDLIHKSSSKSLISIMKIISFLGSFPALLLIGIALILYLKKDKRYYEMFFLLSTSLGTFIINFILKLIFQRVRPLDYFRIKQGGYSFPSGHAMVSMAFYTSLIYMFLQEDRFDRKRLTILNIVVVSLIGFSRLYLGVHWPTDILVGYIIGYTWFRIMRDLYKYIKDVDRFKLKSKS